MEKDDDMMVFHLCYAEMKHNLAQRTFFGMHH